MVLVYISLIVCQLTLFSLLLSSLHFLNLISSLQPSEFHPRFLSDLPSPYAMMPYAPRLLPIRASKPRHGFCADDTKTIYREKQHVHVRVNPNPFLSCNARLIPPATINQHFPYGCKTIVSRPSLRSCLGQKRPVSAEGTLRSSSSLIYVECMLILQPVFSLSFHFNVPFTSDHLLSLISFFCLLSVSHYTKPTVLEHHLTETAIFGHGILLGCAIT